MSEGRDYEIRARELRTIAASAGTAPQAGPCPVCGRLVRRLVHPDVDPPEKAGRANGRDRLGTWLMCERCACYVSDWTRQRCTGWRVGGLRQHHKPHGRHVLHPQWPLCQQCGSGLLVIPARGKRPVLKDEACCPLCEDRGHNGSRLRAVGSVGDHTVFHCRRCSECWLERGDQLSLAQSLRSYRERINEAQRAELHRLQAGGDVAA